ncbi:MAG: hypothetical protein WBC04_06960, partial [Candidatus Acidiferrales bacterium]
MNNAPKIEPMNLSLIPEPFDHPDWVFAVSRQGHINLSVKVRLRPKDYRVVQGALKLILEAIFEADFCSNSYGFRPQRSPHRALAEVRR